MRAILLGTVILLMALAPTAASAQERLVLGAYPGHPAWREITNQAEGDTGAWIREEAPRDQSGPEYSDIVTAQSFPSARAVDPATFLRSIFARSQSDCVQVSVNGPVLRTEGGFPVAYAQVYCSRQNGRSFGVNMFFKVIKGDEALYSINRDMRVPASAVAGVQSFSKDQAAAAAALLEAAVVANRYLSQSVYVCGGRSTDARCAASRR